jgi:hypothetical protein
MEIQQSKDSCYYDLGMRDESFIDSDHGGELLFRGALCISLPVGGKLNEREARESFEDLLRVMKKVEALGSGGNFMELAALYREKLAPLLTMTRAWDINFS